MPLEPWSRRASRKKKRRIVICTLARAARRVLFASICTYGILEHFSPQVKRGSHLICGNISVTVGRRPAPQCIMLPQIRLMQSIWFAEEIFSTHVHNTPSRPGLFLSARPEFLERGEGFNKFAGDGPSKKRVSIFFTRLLRCL